MIGLRFRGSIGHIDGSLKYAFARVGEHVANVEAGCRRFGPNSSTSVSNRGYTIARTRSMRVRPSVPTSGHPYQRRHRMLARVLLRAHSARRTSGARRPGRRPPRRRACRLLRNRLHRHDGRPRRGRSARRASFHRTIRFSPRRDAGWRQSRRKAFSWNEATHHSPTIPSTCRLSPIENSRCSNPRTASRSSRTCSRTDGSSSASKSWPTSRRTSCQTPPSLPELS